MRALGDDDHLLRHRAAVGVGQQLFRGAGEVASWLMLPISTRVTRAARLKAETRVSRRWFMVCSLLRGPVIRWLDFRQPAGVSKPWRDEAPMS